MSDRAARDGEPDASDTGPIAVPGSSPAADTGPVPLAAPGAEPRTAPGRALPPAGEPAGAAASRAPHRGAGQVRPRAALRPAAPGIPPVPQRPVPQRSGRAPRTPRSAEATAFVLHQFPLGHMPVSASAPARQHAVDEGAGQRGVLPAAPEQEPAVRAAGGGLGPGIALPAELSADDPGGGLEPSEWDRTYRDSAGGYVWPEPGQPGSAESLPEGAEVDLLGTPVRRLVFAAGTPFAERAQPPEYRGRSYRRFRVRLAVPVVREEAQAWFGQPGGGTRYVLPRSVVELVASGHLVEVAGDCGAGSSSGEAPGGSGASERADTRGQVAGANDPLDPLTASTGVRFGPEGESGSQEVR
ncbi:hypothetical protein GCM10027174_38310 [Salinifilum aidingensis]